MWMLDTNICIYLIKRNPHIVLQRIQTKKPSEICISAITLSELQYGVEKSTAREKNSSALIQFLAPLNIMPFDHNAAIIYGEIRAYLERKGKPIGALDALIGAHALSIRSTLVTNNVREFRRIPKLSIENWSRK